MYLHCLIRSSLLKPRNGRSDVIAVTDTGDDVLVVSTQTWKVEKYGG
jgi:hypothetical protein